MAHWAVFNKNFLYGLTFYITVVKSSSERDAEIILSKQRSQLVSNVFFFMSISICKSTCTCLSVFEWPILYPNLLGDNAIGLRSLLHIIVRMQLIWQSKCHKYWCTARLRVSLPKYLVFLCRERFSISGYMRNNRSQQWSEKERSARRLKPVSSFFDLMASPPPTPNSFNLNQMD